MMNSIFTKNNIFRKNNLRDRTYQIDGAKCLNGRIAVLSTLITSQISSKAVYVHCYAHRLNLALEAACSKIFKVKEMVGIAKSLYAYVEGSAKRSHLFKNIQDE